MAKCVRIISHQPSSRLHGDRKKNMVGALTVVVVVVGGDVGGCD